MEQDIPYATNGEVARVLFHVASLLEMMEYNRYRARAYRRTAIGIVLLPKPLFEYVACGEDVPIDGLGERMRGHLHDLINSGHMGVHDVLMGELGEPLVSLLSIHGIGPKSAVQLVRELQLGSLHDLADAARGGRIRLLRGFGAKREAAIGKQVEERLIRGAA